ncbi:hypothetical protein [Frankia sp. Cppng1_Ct_nod]|uniref:hypothetical protein n=1 Tax=Frankia sp. Cppng1_Ct_nod TaxID=2897162 RepID=UPI001040E561|nr:hypothetical protein [Frankia sp. Cppng1_Ct_nod]
MWFLLIPPVAVIITLVWFARRSRPDRRLEALITVEGYRRSMAALASRLDVTPDPSGHHRPVPTRTGVHSTEAR